MAKGKKPSCLTTFSQPLNASSQRYETTGTFATYMNTSRRTRQILTTATISQQKPDITLPSESLANTAIDAGAIHVHTKAKRSQNSDMPLHTWRMFRQSYLDACLILDGRGRHWNDTCATLGCSHDNASFQCVDCLGMRLYCRSCIITQHQLLPLHGIEEWKNEHFCSVSLQSLGLSVQLGHLPGQACPFCIYKRRNFSVIHSNGIHSIMVNFCGCKGAPEHRDQLLEIGWWPSTPLEPQSAATMDVLRTFHILNLQGHLAPTDFYRGLEQMTDGHGLSSIPDWLSQWMLIVREWRHVKMTKRAGRGHSLTGIEGTLQGELSIPCRSCPQPNINLPSDWDKAPSSSRWLYALLLAEDANFKQKARLRRNETCDPPLGPGWGTFVANEPYLEYVSQFASQDEISHCVGFAALSSANSKSSKGLRATGVGAVSCARHQMFRPNGMGDLQIGERYCNMDYLFLSSISGTTSQSIKISYDIACQWGSHFFDRANSPALPPSLRPSPFIELMFLVPKFHLEVHTKQCQAPFSHNYNVGLGRTDGEGVERNWANLNRIASSVSLMGAGGRWDTIDDFCNFANWRKMVTLPNTLLRKMSLAIPQAIIHHRAFLAFSQSLRGERLSQLAEWERQVTEWEVDHTKFCPYTLPDEKITFEEVKRQLSQEDNHMADKSFHVDGLPPGEFIIMALGIEATQLELLTELRCFPDAIKTKASFRYRQMDLQKRIDDFIKIQGKYLPRLSHYLASTLRPDEANPAPAPQLIPLHLPSLIPSQHRISVCPAGLTEIEDRLRFAQASEALVNLRLQLAKRSCVLRWKQRNEESQRYYTRFRDLQNQTQAKIKAFQLQYTVAREALISLRGHGAWEQQFQILRSSDVRGLGEHTLANEEDSINEHMRKLAGVDGATPRWDTAEFDALLTEPVPSTELISNLACGEGTRTLSWIWYSTTGEELGNTSTESYLRVEWLRCRARAARWKEELELLEEEMCRAIEFCKWKANWWATKQIARKTGIPHLDEGIASYALEQREAELQHMVAWSTRWAAIRLRGVNILEGSLGEEDNIADLGTLHIEIEDEDDSFSVL